MSGAEKRCCGGNDKGTAHTQDCETAAAASERMRDAIGNAAAGRTIADRRRALEEAESAFTAVLDAMHRDHLAALARARVEALEEAAAVDLYWLSAEDQASVRERIRALITTPAPATIPAEKVREVLARRVAYADREGYATDAAALRGVADALDVPLGSTEPNP